MFDDSDFYGMGLDDQVRAGMLGNPAALNQYDLRSSPNMRMWRQKIRERMLNRIYNNPSVPVPIDMGGYAGDGTNNAQPLADGSYGAQDPQTIEQNGLAALRKLQLADQVQFDPNQGAYVKTVSLSPQERQALTQQANQYIAMKQQSLAAGNRGGINDYDPSLEATRRDRMKNDPNPPAMPGPLDALKDLLASAKGDALKGAIPMLLKSGILGAMRPTGDPDIVVHSAPISNNGGDPVENFLQNFSSQLTGDYETDTKALKDYIDLKKGMRDLNTPANPITLSKGQIALDPYTHQIIGQGAPEQAEYGQPFPVIASDGKQHMAVADKQGNIKIVDGFAPLPKTGQSVVLNNPDGTTTSVDLGGGTGSSDYPLAVAPASANGQSNSGPPPLIRDQSKSPARGGQGGVYYGKDGKIIATATNNRTTADEATLAGMQRIDPILTEVMQYSPQFQTAWNQASAYLGGQANKYLGFLGANFQGPSDKAAGEAAQAKAVESLINIYNLPKTDTSTELVTKVIAPHDGESPDGYKNRVANELQNLRNQSEQAKGRLREGYNLNPAQQNQDASNDPLGIR